MHLAHLPLHYSQQQLQPRQLPLQPQQNQRTIMEVEPLREPMLHTLDSWQQLVPWIMSCVGLFIDDVVIHQGNDELNSTHIVTVNLMIDNEKMSYSSYLLIII